MVLFTRAFSTYLFAAEILIAAFLYLLRFPHRKGWLYSYFAGHIVLFGASFFLYWIKALILDGTSNYSEFTIIVFLRSYGLSAVVGILQLCLCVVVIGIICRTSLKNIILIGCASFATQNVARSVFNIVLICKGETTLSLMSVFMKDWTNILIYLGIYAVVYAAGYFIFARKSRELDDEYIPKQILIPIVAVIFLIILISNVPFPRESSAKMPFLFLATSQILLCVLILSIEFIILEWFRMRIEHTLLNNIIERQEARFTFIKDSMENVNLKAHDMKHKTGLLMKALNGNGDSVAMEELGRINYSVKTWESIYKTDNNALDIVLSEKTQICRDEDIDFTVMADGKAIGSLSEVDVYVLFGNALDNAIEAVRKIENSDGRTVRLTVNEKQGMAVIRIENSFAEKPEIINGVIRTSKADKTSHGFGIKSIKKIVEKYGGLTEVKITENLFCLNIVIPIMEDSH